MKNKTHSSVLMFLIVFGILAHCRERALSQEAGACITPPSGLISWWSADNTASDSVGTNHGTLYGGVTYVAGKVGRAFSFDGASHVEVPDSPNLNFAINSPITVELWAYRTGTAGSMSILGKRVDCIPDINYQLALNTDNGEGLSFSSGYDVPGHAVLTTTDMPLNTWIHLAGTFDGNNTLRFYTNGLLAAVATGTLRAPNTASLLIGGSGSCGKWVGHLDEVCIYDRALTDAEIFAIYSSGDNGKCKLHTTIRVSQVEVCWKSRADAAYQLQYRSDLTTNAWAPLVHCVQGNGTTNCIYDAIAVGQPQRFYRVVLTNCVPPP